MFHSEADFQHSLAWVIREQHPGIEVRFEYPVTLDGRSVRTSTSGCAMDGHATAIELKYWDARGLNFDRRPTRAYDRPGRRR